MLLSEENFPKENILVESGEPNFPSAVLMTSSVMAVSMVERKAVFVYVYV